METDLGSQDIFIEEVQIGSGCSAKTDASSMGEPLLVRRAESPRADEAGDEL